MQHLIKLCLALFLLLVTPLTFGEPLQPYCYTNITETSYKVVTKTRIKNVSSKNFFKKIISKKDTQVEIYEDLEPVYKIKVERICCEGYKLNEYDLCEPQCVKNGCPQNSKCVEPEICECSKGYFSKRSAHDGKHYCEPICEEACPQFSECIGHNQCACKRGYYYNKNFECLPYCASGCPHKGVCVAPNSCSCQEGYKAIKGSCLPTCAAADQCQNGECVSNDYCICNNGFNWNNENSICQSDNMQTSTFDPDLSETQQALEVETDIETFLDDIDPNQVFDETIESTTMYTTDEYDVTTHSSLTVHHKCPDDYIFHKGQCRPLKFVTNAIDCWQKPCQDQNAVCLGNGTCACKEGFELLRIHSLNQTFVTECLLPAQYESRIRELQEDPQKNAIEEPTNWTSIFFVVFGILILVSALVFLGMKLFLRQTGEMDVEGKNLACVYDNRAISETEKSVI